MQDLPMLKEKNNQWNMIYRKMTEEQDDRYVLTLLRRAKIESKFEDYNIKITLFEIMSGRQDVFVYTEKEILSQDQQDELAKGKTDISVIFKKATDSRLKIKKL